MSECHEFKRLHLSHFSGSDPFGKPAEASSGYAESKDPASPQQSSSASPKRLSRQEILSFGSPKRSPKKSIDASRSPQRSTDAQALGSGVSSSQSSWQGISSSQCSWHGNAPGSPQKSLDTIEAKRNTSNSLSMDANTSKAKPEESKPTEAVQTRNLVYLALHSCQRLESIAGLISGPGMLEELQLVRLPRLDLATRPSELQALTDACTGQLKALELGFLPLCPSVLCKLLSPIIETLAELTLCSVCLTPEGWAAVSQLRALRDLRLREVRSADPCGKGCAESTLLVLVRKCSLLRQIDLYRMRGAVTDRLCLALLAEGRSWSGGAGLRWLRLDLRYGAASDAALQALSEASRCANFELRLRPADSSLQSPSPGLPSLRRIQAFLRGALTRQRLRQMHFAAARLQALGRAWKIRRLFHDQRRCCRQIQAFARYQAANRKRKRHIHAAVRIQSVCRGHLGRRHLEAQHRAAKKLQAFVRRRAKLLQTK